METSELAILGNQVGIMKKLVPGAAANAADEIVGHEHWVSLLKTGIHDPRAELAPTAQRLLAGAERVVLEKGFGSLTLANISKASHENVAAVKYYFGNKAGLVRVLLDTVIYDQVSALSTFYESGLASKEIGTLATDTAVLNQPIPAQRILFAVLSHALMDDQLLEQLRTYYQTFFELHLGQVSTGEGIDLEQRAYLRGLATLLSAIGDGLSIQALVAPGCFDIEETLAALDVLLKHGMRALAQTQPRPINAT